MEITIKTLASPSRKGDENEKERKKTRMAIAKLFSLHPNVKTKAINCKAFCATHKRNK